ncbi:MAG: TerB family tellurite resistance protein, partial [Gammaproteobacteria bacterium]|nr:TerB family tellurite resistance protein [Gammaproteobacteria bacterium]MDE2108922.1 TerB family tellurite resistance protein [Gammaproteobacteria bacterium]
RADMQEHPDELARAQAVLAQRFSLSNEQAAGLLKDGVVESDRSASLYRFVTLINRQFDTDAKRDLLVMLWRVAYADGLLDKYEDALMHKLADLMYVPVVELMRAKNLALQGK